MSLINNMLKDLDKRKGAQAPPAASPPLAGSEDATLFRPGGGQPAPLDVTLLPSSDVSRVPVPQRSPTRGLWLLLPLVLVAGGAALHLGGYVDLTKLPLPGKNAPVAPPAPLSPPAQKPEPTAAPLVNRLAAIEQGEEQDRLQLLFRLTAKPNATILPENEGRRLTLTLDNTENDDKVMDPLPLHEPLLAIHRHAKGKNLLLQMDFSDPIHYNYSVDDKRNQVKILVARKEPALPPPPASSEELEESLVSGQKTQPGQDLGLLASPAPAPASPPSPQLEREPVQKSPEESFREGVLALEQGDRDQGILLLTDSLNSRPGHLPAREKLARAMMAGGRLSEADRLLTEGLAIAPGHAPFVILEARLLEARGERKKAISLMFARPPAMDKDPDYHAFLAGLLLQDGQAELASGLYGEALGFRPEQGAWWMGLGLALERTGKPDMARSAFQNALTKGTLSAPLKQFILSRLQKLPAARETRATEP